MKRIRLTQGKSTLVDDDIYQEVGSLKWYAHKSRGKYYAYHNSKGGGKVYLHSYALKTPKGFITDHIDGDTLNNQVSNLRVATISQNAMNRGRQRNNISGYKGIYLHKKSRKWQAKIMVGGIRLYLGEFFSAQDAYSAYCGAATKYHGDFANVS